MGTPGLKLQTDALELLLIDRSMGTRNVLDPTTGKTREVYDPVLGMRGVCTLTKTSRDMHTAISNNVAILTGLFACYFPLAPHIPHRNASELWKEFKHRCHIAFNTQNDLPFIEIIRLPGLRFTQVVQLRNGHVAGALYACSQPINLTQGGTVRAHYPKMSTIDPSIQNPREQIHLAQRDIGHAELLHTIELPNEKIVYTQGYLLVVFDPKTGTQIHSSTPFVANHICRVMAIPEKNRVVVHSVHDTDGTSTINLVNLELKEEQIDNEHLRLKESQIEKLDLDKPETFTILPDKNIAVLCRGVGPNESDCILVLDPETKQVLRQKNIPANRCAAAAHPTRPFTALPCGSIIVGQRDGTIEIHNLQTGESGSWRVYADATPIEHVQVLSWRHIALVARIEGENVLKIWDNQTKKECAALQSKKSDLDPMLNEKLYSLPNGEIIIMTRSLTLTLWNPQTNRYTSLNPPKHVLQSFGHTVFGHACSQPSNGRFIAAFNGHQNQSTDLCFFDFDADYGHILAQINEGIRGDEFARNSAKATLFRMPGGIQYAVYRELPCFDTFCIAGEEAPSLPFARMLWTDSTPEQKSQAIIAYLAKRGTTRLEWGPPLSPILEPEDEPAAAPVAEPEAGSEPASEPRSAGSEGKPAKRGTTRPEWSPLPHPILEPAAAPVAEPEARSEPASEPRSAGSEGKPASSPGFFGSVFDSRSAAGSGTGSASAAGSAAESEPASEPRSGSRSRSASAPGSRSEAGSRSRSASASEGPAGSASGSGSAS